MISKKATKLISESRIQARRDLKSARVLLTLPDPHLENVAFLLEQSFEKIVNASYVRYMLETGSASWTKICDDISNHDIDFILDMLINFYKNCVKTLAQAPKTWFDCDDLCGMLPKETEKLMCSPENFDESLKQIHTLNDEVTWVKKNFIKFMSELDSKSMPDLDLKPSDLPQIPDMIKNITDSTTDSIPDQQMLHEHATFLMHILIAPYVLSHAVYSRYPLSRHGMYNLEAYRTNPKLNGFFNTLADHIQIMLDTEAGFTKLLIKTHSINSNMSRHNNKS